MQCLYTAYSTILSITKERKCFKISSFPTHACYTHPHEVFPTPLYINISDSMVI